MMFFRNSMTDLWSMKLPHVSPKMNAKHRLMRPSALFQVLDTFDWCAKCFIIVGVKVY